MRDIVNHSMRRIAGEHTLAEVVQPDFVAQKTRELVDREAARYGLAVRALTMPFVQLRAN